MNKYVIGVDYGTDSVRSVIVDTKDGRELSSSVFYYPRWKDGLYCDAPLSRFRQHPLDYIEGLEKSIRECIEQAGPEQASAIKAISIDTTGSTPVAVNEKGVPLALLPEFEANPNAMFVLWKDHTALQEAAEINAHATRFEENYLRFAGGIYSSEWYWAKLLHILRQDEAVRKACYTWVEHCDWIPFLLTGGSDARQIKRSVCAAGHKALWADAFGGFPPDEFFSSLDPLLKGFTTRFGDRAYTTDQPAGKLSAEWAARLGLSPDTLVGIGAFDAHVGAVGGQITPYYLSKVMGTSTCDMLVAPAEEVGDKLVKGICGQVNGSIIPGMIGMEAGQSAFGDTYAWFKNLLSWPLKNLLDQSAIIDAHTADKLSAEISDKLLPELSRQASLLPLEEDAALAVDWLNGRRTPDANQSLGGAMMGLNLGSDAPRVFRAWVEATCFGAKSIVDRFIREGISVKGLIGLGGVARKSPYVMQLMANVMNRPIRIHRSEQTVAAGAAMFAATVAGIYPRVEDAMSAMGQGFDTEYIPEEKTVSLYAARYNKFQELGAAIEKLT